MDGIGKRERENSFGSRPLEVRMVGPQPQDRILILKKSWLELILDGSKTMEIRSMRLSPGRYWLGNEKMIYGSVKIGVAIPVLSVEQWRSLRPRHLCDNDALPYKNTFALPILSAQVTRRVPFRHPRGAIGIVKYRRV